MATLALRGSGTPVTTGTTWASVTNAVDGAAGSNPATYTTMTSATSGAVATIEVTGYAFSGTIASNATLNSVSVSLRHFENNTGRFASVRFQPYDGATAIGTLQTCTLATAARNDAFTFPVTLAQIRSATFKIRVTITGAASTQSRICSIDYIDVTADYTALVPNTGTGTGSHGWATSATGRKVPKGSAVEDWTFALDATGSAPSTGPNTGTATTSWTAVPTATGKRTPKGTAATSYVEAPTATGKRTPKSQTTVAWLAAPAASGKRTPKATATAAHVWTAAATGTAPVPGDVDLVGFFAGHPTVAMQLGSQRVVAWQMNGQGAPV